MGQFRSRAKGIRLSGSGSLCVLVCLETYQDASPSFKIFAGHWEGRRYTRGMTVTADNPRPPKVQIADTLRAEIKSGQPGAGKKLPSIRALAKRFGVATGTVQAALDLLRQEALIDSSGNQGVYVRSNGADDEVDTVVIERSILLEIHEALARLDERVAALEAERDR